MTSEWRHLGPETSSIQDSYLQGIQHTATQWSSHDRRRISPKGPLVLQISQRAPHGTPADRPTVERLRQRMSWDRSKFRDRKFVAEDGIKQQTFGACIQTHLGFRCCERGNWDIPSVTSDDIYCCSILSILHWRGMYYLQARDNAV